MGLFSKETPPDASLGAKRWRLLRTNFPQTAKFVDRAIGQDDFPGAPYALTNAFVGIFEEITFKDGKPCPDDSNREDAARELEVRLERERAVLRKNVETLVEDGKTHQRERARLEDEGRRLESMAADIERNLADSQATIAMALSGLAMESEHSRLAIALRQLLRLGLDKNYLDAELLDMAKNSSITERGTHE